MKVNYFLAAATFHVVALVFIILAIISCFIFLSILMLEDKYKNKKTDEKSNVKPDFWTRFIALFSNNTVKTVYSDKSLNYSGTEFLPVPAKAPTDKFTYEFLGWDKNAVDENGNFVVKAIYLQKVTQCRVNVFDDDEKTLLKTAVVEYGSGINLDDVKPTKPETKEFTYEFVGWNHDTNEFFENTNIHAVYRAVPKKYTYVFYDDDGTTVISQGSAIYGTPIFAPKTTEKVGEDGRVYQFEYWKNYTEGMLLVRNSNFVAVYKLKDSYVDRDENEVVLKTNERPKTMSFELDNAERAAKRPRVVVQSREQLLSEKRENSKQKEQLKEEALFENVLVNKKKK